MRMSLFARNDGRGSLPAHLTVAVACTAAALLSGSCAWAQSSTSSAPGLTPVGGTRAIPASAPITPPKKPAPVPQSTDVGVNGPRWSELTPSQQIALKPLAANWDGLAEPRKRKWLSLSRNFPNMSTTEQAKLQSRMTEWATLSAQQRTQARLNYANAKTIPPSEKQAKWKAYQALSPEEKSRLATKAPPPPKGAAPAVKPVPTGQLTVVPAARHPAKQGQRNAAPSTKGDKNTPQPPVSAAAPQTPASAYGSTSEAPPQPKAD